MQRLSWLFGLSLMCHPTTLTAAEAVRPHYETPTVKLPATWRTCNSGTDCVLLYYGCNSVTAVRGSYKISAEKIIATGKIRPILTCAPTDTNDVVADCLRGMCTASPFLY